MISLRLPPLRERRGDILPLARRAIQGCTRGGQVPLSLSADAEQKLLRYDWPGNARELTNIVQRAAWLASGGQIHAGDLDTGVGSPAAQGGASGARAGSAPSPARRRTRVSITISRSVRRELILATLALTGGSRKLAAERLGISPRTLRHKLQQLKAAGVSVPRLHDHQLAAV